VKSLIQGEFESEKLRPDNLMGAFKRDSLKSDPYPKGFKLSAYQIILSPSVYLLPYFYLIFIYFLSLYLLSTFLSIFYLFGLH